MEIKDKTVTVESLKALHDYNVKTYETKENVEDLLSNKFDKPKNDIVPIANGGTNASDGATGLKNLFEAGATVLSSYQYGDKFPTDPIDEGGNGEEHIAGRIFFKKLSE